MALLKKQRASAPLQNRRSAPRNGEVKDLIQNIKSGKVRDLRAARLDGLDLRGAKLQGCDLRGARLVGANLKGAVLTGSDLRGANLSRAELCGAWFQEADLRGARLWQSSWPLWCGGAQVRVDLALVARLAAQICVLICEAPEFREVQGFLLDFIYRLDPGGVVWAKNLLGSNRQLSTAAQDAPGRAIE